MYAKMKYDVVYVLGKGSRWNDNEIRYSIRSLKKHFKELGNVVVVGERPIWMKSVIHIPFTDNININKDARMMQKIAAACDCPKVSDDFIFFTDDIYLNKDLVFSDFKGWHEGPILYDAAIDSSDHRKIGAKTTLNRIGNWFLYVYNTGDELKKRGFSDFNYDRAHCCQPINKTEYLEIMKQWDIEHNNYTCSNIYQNCTQLFDGEDIRGRNLKIYNPLSPFELREHVNDKWVWNFSDKGLNNSIRNYLQELYPEPSEYEIIVPGTTRKEAAENWFNNGCNYDEGVVIFATLAPKNRRLLLFFEKKRKNILGDKKLKQTLKIWLR